MKIKNKLIGIIFLSLLAAVTYADTTLPVEIQISNADKWPSSLTVSIQLSKITGNLGNPYWLSSNTFRAGNNKTIGTNNYAFYFQQPDTPELDGSFVLTYTAASSVDTSVKITGTYLVVITKNKFAIIDNWDSVGDHHLCEFESGTDFYLEFPGPAIHISCLNVPSL